MYEYTAISSESVPTSYTVEYSTGGASLSSATTASTTTTYGGTQTFGYTSGGSVTENVNQYIADQLRSSNGSATIVGVQRNGSVQYESNSQAQAATIVGVQRNGSVQYESSSQAQAVSSSATVSQIAQDLLSLGVSGSATNVSHHSHGQLSLIEKSILGANNPLEFEERESLTVHGNTGIWINRSEVVNWRGEVPITQYQINEDLSPEIIRKQTEQRLIYEQEVAVRYLRPPTPPPPGEIIIKQEKNIPTPPAPPLVIRQVPPRPETPAPLVVREAPPRAPVTIGQKMITISGKRLPPPPRKVVIERLAPIPSKPQSIIIERWLPYGQSKRRVIFQKNTVPDPVISRPRNVIIQWESPEVQIKKEFKDLGVIRANPVEYVERYGTSLKTHTELPQFVKEIRPPTGIVLASEHVSSGLHELEGDVDALKLIDLDYEGLSEYKTYVSKFGSSLAANSFSGFSKPITELFQFVDSNSSGQISQSEAESLILRFNSTLGRSYGQADASLFIRSLDSNKDGFIQYEEFRSALLKHFS